MLTAETIIKYSNNADELAKAFLNDYWVENTKSFPVNPFDMLKYLNVHFIFRNFDGIEGIYLPADTLTDYELVAINHNRRITRQRFTAAHEICHIIKDSRNKEIVCISNSNDYIEKFADAFAASLLMPSDELKNQVEGRCEIDNYLTLQDILIISHYFGTSFEACYYRIKSIFPYLINNYSKKEFDSFRPDRKRKELGLNHINLYFDLFDSWNDVKTGFSSEFSKQVFKHKYVYNDARLEGVAIDYTAVSEIVEDILKNRKLSKYCTENEKLFCEIAGHVALYDHIFDKSNYDKIDIYSLSTLNKLLFSCMPYPEYGGKTRESNTLVLGIKFEVVDWHDVMAELGKTESLVDKVIKHHANYKTSELIKLIARIHHRVTQIHPFHDGNGRTSRAFMNIMLMHIGLIPIYVKLESKNEYYAALELADRGNYDLLYEYLMKQLIESHIELFYSE